MFSAIKKDDLLKEIEIKKDGLTSKEAEEKLKIYGENFISFRRSILDIVKNNILNFFNLLLIFATLISLLLGESITESIIIFCFFVVSVIIASYEDYRSENLLNALNKYFKNEVWVKRDGEWQKIDQKNIVPGDYIKLKIGDVVPADILILKAEDVLVDESILTGESQLVSKTEKETNSFNDNFLWYGTLIIKGEIEGIVVRTGKNSYWGSLIEKALKERKETLYAKILNEFAKKVTYFAILLAFLVIFFNFFKPEPLNFKEIALFSLTMTVALVPEFLSTMTVLTLSLISFKLIKKGLVIRRISALEDLGVVDVICTDKTGTLTTNILKLKEIISYDNDLKEVVKFFLMDYYLTKDETPYERAILEKFPQIEIDNYTLIEDIPFSPQTKIEKIIVRDQNSGKILEIIKGAPEEIINNFFNGDEKYLEDFRKADVEGYRTLALAVKNDKEYKFLGLFKFEDPLKESSFEAVDLAKKLNLEIKILTGDSPFVAKKVAQELKIYKGEKIILGEEIRKLDENKLKEVVLNHNVFARLLPEDKLIIIETLKKLNKKVAFLGEGINDILALKSSYIGFVVDTSAEASKEVADIVLTKKDLKLIIEAVYEGRRALENISKYLKHTMSDNFGNITAIVCLNLFLTFLPLTPIQILLTNFLTDLPLIAFANDYVDLKEIKKPLKILSFHLIVLLFILGLISGSINVIGYLLVKDKPIEVIRTFIFLLTTLTGLIVSFSIRTKDWFFKTKISKFFFLASLISLLLTLIFVFLPQIKKAFQFSNLSVNELKFILFLVLIFFVLNEVAKKLFYKKFPEVI